MRVIYKLAFTVMVILNSIELSSQFDCLPNGAPIPGVPRGGSSSFASEGPHSPARPHSSTRSSSHAEPSHRSRSRSPATVNRTSPTRLPFSNVLGYGLDQIEFLRLISYKNPQRQFKLRRYAFPADKRIELLDGTNKYRPIPNQEQIVLSTLDGDAFAILESTDILAGLYTLIPGRVRVKMNIINGKVTPLTKDEAKETPIGRNRQTLYAYRVEHLNHNHGPLASAEPTLRSSSPYRHMALPTRLPSSGEFGYELDQLHFIRLISRKNPNKILELQRYTFPMDKPILLLDGQNRYRPIPIQQLIVLTTVSDDADVFAILESENDLAGIYTRSNSTGAKARVKINMRSGMITQLTKQEMDEVPVRRLRPIIFSFKIHHVKHNPPRHPIN